MAVFRPELRKNKEKSIEGDSGFAGLEWLSIEFINWQMPISSTKLENNLPGVTNDRSCYRWCRLYWQSHGTCP